MITTGIITHSYYPRLGGTEYATYYLANALNKAHNSIAVVACSNMPEVSSAYRYPHKVYRALKFGPLTPFLSSVNARIMVQREKVQILLGQNLYNSSMNTRYLQKKTGLPVIGCSRGSDVQTVPEINYGICLHPEKKKAVQQMITSSDHLIGLSTLNKNNIIELGGAEEKISVIPNGVHFEEIEKVPYINLRSKYGINEDDFVIITVGRNSPVKRLSLLFRALEIIKNKAVKCICVGPGMDLGKEAAKYGIQDKIIITGQIPNNPGAGNPPYPELINMYRMANCFISTSYVDCFSNAAIEALAVGLPLIVGKKHGITDVMTTPNSGFILNKESPEELAEYIDNILINRDLYYNTKNQIKASVQHLCWEHIAARHIELYRKILA